MPSVPVILLPDHRERAVGLLRRYFGLDGSAAFTGSRFERLGGGGDSPANADRVTAEDIVSLSMLSIRLPGWASQRLLEDDEFSEVASAHLAKLPTDLDLVDADPETLAAGGVAAQLWSHLYQLRGVGPTTVSKLMARKRPPLIPVWDSVIQRAFGLKNSGAQWRIWRDNLAADNQRLHRDMLVLREKAGLTDEISALRILDVVVWMAHRSPSEQGDEVAALVG
ncbi:DUF6308 family protein [Bogoriella caseilytica]|uniref:Uncharacterized protein n=1 Tax=Bogoriella caseilytica TaxID=56055 RepID=A0A3N2BAV3_9MICO|nr:DUF6308 family protein [Bogoriella caseilytica]ROR72389.1 hypothetical protein EDD31_0740 [Bogoriella caseilytica]